jgi:hypothetical protein
MGYCVDLVSHPIPSGYINRDKAISGGRWYPTYSVLGGSVGVLEAVLRRPWEEFGRRKHLITGGKLEFGAALG